MPPTTPTNPSSVFDELVDLYRNYSRIYRRNIAFGKFEAVRNSNLGPDVLENPSDALLRESLLEHVGALPVTAVFLYTYLENKNEINLGKVLQMLAIHDVGEIEVGDEHPHQKTHSFKKAEYDAALKILPNEFHAIYKEYESLETPEAKYAKAVDVVVTFLSDQLLPASLVQKRLAAYNFSWHEVEEKRYEVFAWDHFLKELFAQVIARYRQIAN